MDRRVPILAAAAATLLTASACQDYNFNPVGHCMLQPGTKRIQVSTIATADVLFVVDDSGSMAGEQAALGSQFPRFLDVLARVNKERVGSGLPAYDFHIAVTTTSSYYNEPPVNGSVCSDACPGAEGQNVCCLKGAGGALASPQPPLCDPANDDCATGAGYTCKATCTGLSDVGTYTGTACCNASNAAQPIACDKLGEPCGIFDRFYYDDGLCTPGYAQLGAYPAGRFTADPTNVTPNDTKVLHFTADLPWNTWDWTTGGWGTTAPELQALAAAFDKNVRVGTCGSPQEQGLEVARRAIQAQLGQNGLSQPGVARAEWLHDNSKLVVVWVTDEDDCSAPYSAGGGVVFPLTSDGCVDDANLPASQQREYSAASYADFFTSLGREFGAAFIVSATCNAGSCTPGLCIDSACTVPPNAPGTCGGQWPGTRYLNLAGAFRAKDAEMSVVAGSVCDPFGDSLGTIARIVTPPATLALPTQPAAAEVTVLRITNEKGDTIKTCSEPAPAAPASAGVDDPTAQAYLAGLGAFDWWYVAQDDPKDPTNFRWKLPSGPSKQVFINHASGRCEASGGQFYSLDYLGRLPAGGCFDLAGEPATTCAAALGGQPTDWNCLGWDGASTTNGGTCTCN